MSGGYGRLLCSDKTIGIFLVGDHSNDSYVGQEFSDGCVDKSLEVGTITRD